MFICKSFLLLIVSLFLIVGCGTTGQNFRAQGYDTYQTKYTKYTKYKKANPYKKYKGTKEWTCLGTKSFCAKHRAIRALKAKHKQLIQGGTQTISDHADGVVKTTKGVKGHVQDLKDMHDTAKDIHQQITN